MQRLLKCVIRLAQAEELLNGLDAEKTEKFITMLQSLGHESPVEHASFTFAVEGVSRSLLAQITRHRHASYSVKSQRYVKEGAFEFVIPPEIEMDENARKIYLKAMQDDQRTYDMLTEILEKKHYQAFIDEGMDEKKARSAAEKKAIEDARYVLPNACETKMMVTMNVRSLYNFFQGAVVIARSGKLESLHVRCFSSVIKHRLHCFENQARPVHMACAAKERCVVANRTRCAENTAQ